MLAADPPGPTPVAIPDAEPIEIAPGTLLVQVPPGDISVNVTVARWQTCDGPEMAAGNGFTVTIVVREHPAKV